MVTVGAGVGITGSASKGKINSNYQSVTQQTEIHAGQGGFNIEVGKNTDLKGAVISSDATPDKNKLSTDTLSYSDIKNKADYSASSTGYSTQTGSKLPITPNVTMPVSGNDGSITKSAIANGTIEVRSNPKKDLSQLNRDTENSLNALGKIFDKKTVQEQQELANLFGQEAYKAVGDLAEKQLKKATTKEEQDKWKEGGEYKVLLHTVVGGVMSELGGNGFTSGAVGAGTSQALQKVLSKIKDPNIRLIASAIIGGSAAKIVSGKTSAGVATAYYGTRYNDYTHRPTTPGSIIFRENDEKGVGRGYYMVGEDGLEYYQKNGVAPGDIYWIADGKYNEDGYQMGDEWIVGDDGAPIAFSWNTVQTYVGDSVVGSIVPLETAINQETGQPIVINGRLAMTYDSNEKYNQAMADYEESKKVPEFIAGFVSPGKKIASATEVIIAGYKSDIAKGSSEATKSFVGKINVGRLTAQEVAQVTERMGQLPIRERGYDCSEIAEDLYQAAGGKGEILNITSKTESQISVTEFGTTAKYEYHQVFSDGEYVFDPRYNSNPVLKEDYLNLINELNGDNVIIDVIR